MIRGRGLGLLAALVFQFAVQVQAHAQSQAHSQDITIENQWAMQKIQAPQVRLTGANCQGIKVAVIDTGIDTAHPYLKTNLVEGRNFTVQTASTDVFDDYGHGTHMASLIKAVCGEVTLIPIKAIKADGTPEGQAYVEAVRFAVAQGAQVINMSFGSANVDPALKFAIADAPHVLFVTVSGNGFMGRGFDLDHYNVYPASFRLPNVVVVTATDESDIRADFANYGGSVVDIAAPGVKIFGAMPLTPSQGMQEAGFRTGQEFMSGTSQATAIVSGAAALYWAQNPQASALEVKAALVERADTLRMPEGRMRQPVRLNLMKLLGFQR